MRCGKNNTSLIGGLKMIRRKDLVDVADKDYDQRRSEFVQCQDCGEEFGGTRGDYFMLSMDKVFVCPACNSENLALARRVCTTKIVKQ